MSASEKTLIDPTDSNIQSTDVLKNEQDLYEAGKLKSFQDEKLEIVYVKHVVWLTMATSHETKNGRKSTVLPCYKDGTKEIYTHTQDTSPYKE